jgi:endonuclease/exonuclease/phosphatase family metal-dependent hydrolase
MILITWNVQWCRGVDGRVDPARIAATARALADFDVLCLQEVAVNFPGLKGSRGEDQPAELAAALPGYQALFAPATDFAGGQGGRSQFGNLILTRLPALQVFRHALPWPPDAAVPSMARVALEAVLATPLGPLRVITTHLEYYSASIRMAQVHALRRLHDEACAHAHAPRPDGDPGEPFAVQPRPVSAIVCGDFNFKPEDPEHVQMRAPFPTGAPAFVDAWQSAHPGQPHPPTVGVHDKSWPLYCCDFAFVTEALAGRIRGMSVEAGTDVSDHQPLVVAFA